ncbi:hypothetical protein YC2023_123345 [Brassica napus]
MRYTSGIAALKRIETRTGEETASEDKPLSRQWQNGRAPAHSEESKPTTRKSPWQLIRIFEERLYSSLKRRENRGTSEQERRQRRSGASLPHLEKPDLTRYSEQPEKQEPKIRSAHDLLADSSGMPSTH